MKAVSIPCPLQGTFWGYPRRQDASWPYGTIARPGSTRRERIRRDETVCIFLNAVYRHIYGGLCATFQNISYPKKYLEENSTRLLLAPVLETDLMYMGAGTYIGKSIFGTCRKAQHGACRTSYLKHCLFPPQVVVGKCFWVSFLSRKRQETARKTRKH